MKKKSTPTVVYKGRRPKIGVVLETGQKIKVQLCPTMYLVASKQYKLNEKAKE